jgi:hypothetical protein
MRWTGETFEMREARIRLPHQKYAYLPTQMNNGLYIMWEYYWARLDWSNNFTGTEIWVRSTNLADVELKIVVRPPPPAPLKPLKASIRASRSKQ